MTERSFLDTNILLYADDHHDSTKQRRAIDLLNNGLRSRKAVLSTQVLQEYFSNATRKLGISPEVAQATVRQLSSLDIVTILPDDIGAAIDLHRLHSVSFWDSLIIRCAQKSGCKVLYSEDLHHSQRFGSLKIVNPFRDA